MKKEVIAYLSGLFDGEGSFCIQIQKRKKYRIFTPRLSMSIKYGHQVLNKLVDNFGGKIYYYKDNMARWHLGSKDKIKAVTLLMLPYLVIKKEIAIKFLNALEIFPKTRKIKWNQKMKDKVINIAIHLNPQSAQKRFSYNI
jgi:hypothetical protein